MRLSAAHLTAFLAACAARTPVDPDDSGTTLPPPPTGEIDTGCTSTPATVEVGTGAKAFEPLADGADVTMVHGPQGGWHVLARARVANTLDVVAIASPIDALAYDSEVSWNRYVVKLQPEAACTGAYAGMYGYLDVQRIAAGDLDTPPELLAGTDLLLTLVVEDTDGRTATDTRTVVAQLDPADGGE